jgi:hypothetical protein
MHRVPRCRVGAQPERPCRYRELQPEGGLKRKSRSAPFDVVSGSLQNSRSFCVGQSMRSSMTFKPYGIFMLLGSYHSQGLVTRVTANDDDYHRIRGL